MTVRSYVQSKIMEKTNYIVGIDIGSSNVVMAVGSKSADGKVVLKAIAQTPSRGVNAGSIENINQLSECINIVKTKLEQQLNIRITEACAGISGAYIRCARLTEHVHVRDHHAGVAQSDVDDLFARMKGVNTPDGEVIMEYIPQNFFVDNREVKDPVGSFGQRLFSTFNFILCDEVQLKRLSMTFKRSGLTLTNTFPNSRIMDKPLLTADERAEGVAIVDIGGLTTDVAVYHNNILRHIATIPMGGNAINRDIHLHGIPERPIERLKRIYGSAVAEFVSDQKLIQIPSMGHRSNGGVLRRNLATIIEARLTDIAEFVKLEIKDSGYANKLPYGIVLTGGSSVIEHIDELFHRVTGYEVRCAGVNLGEIAESLPERNCAACTAVIALLMKASEQGLLSTMATQFTTPPTPPYVGGTTTFDTTPKSGNNTITGVRPTNGVGTAPNGSDVPNVNATPHGGTTPSTEIGTTSTNTTPPPTNNPETNIDEDDDNSGDMGYDGDGENESKRKGLFGGGFNIGKNLEKLTDWINLRFEKSHDDEEI